MELDVNCGMCGGPVIRCGGAHEATGVACPECGHDRGLCRGKFHDNKFTPLPGSELGPKVEAVAEVVEKPARKKKEDVKPELVVEPAPVVEEVKAEEPAVEPAPVVEAEVGVEPKSDE